MTTRNTQASETFDLTFDLMDHQTLRLPRGIAVTVRVERGTLLVTQEGDLEDHVLEEACELVVPDRGVAVAWALTDARVSVRAADRGRRAA